MGKYIATTGSDGFLNIYQIQENQSSAKFCQKIKICEKKVSAERSFDLEMQWLQDGETILIPGKTTLGVVHCDENGDWDIQYEERVKHNKEINIVMAISDEILVTHSQVDSMLKIWHLNEDGCKTLFEFQLKKPAISVVYDNVSKQLAVMDNECCIGFFKKDFESGEEPKPDEEEIEDIDLENLDMEDLEEEEEQSQKTKSEKAPAAEEKAALESPEGEEQNAATQKSAKSEELEDNI